MLKNYVRYEIMKRRNILLLLTCVAGVSVFIIFLKQGPSAPKKSPYIQLEYPLKKVLPSMEYDANVTVWVAEDVQPNSLVDLKLFGEFSPPISAEQAEERFGAPDRTWSRDVSTYYSYDLPTAEVQIVLYKERWDGWGKQPADWEEKRKRWILYAIPRDDSHEQLLHPVLHSQWEGVPEGKMLTIMGKNGPSIRIKKTDNKVARVRWHSHNGW